MDETRIIRDQDTDSYELETQRRDETGSDRSA